MARIEKLTNEQIARMAEFRDKWIKIGLCTDPADRPRAEAAILEMYRCGGMKPPQRIVWCGSPLSQGLTRAIILDKKLMEGTAKALQGKLLAPGASVWDSVGDSVWDSVGASVRASVRASVGDSVWDSVWASVGASVWDSVGASVGDSVWDSVGASVWASVRASVWASVRASVWASVGASVRDSVGDSVGDSVWDSVWDSVGASVWASVRDSVGDSVGDSVYGQHEAAWLAFYAFFAEPCALTRQTEKLSGLWELARSAGWTIPHEHICWVSERHRILARDDSGRLHCLTGPAVAYPDGWAIYAVHGVRVPERLIEQRNQLIVADVDGQDNAEVRRVALELFGHDRYIQESGAKLIHQDSRGKLWRKELPGDEPLIMVEVVNSTPEPTGEFKRYWLRVPPQMRKASEAVAWTFGIEKAQEYAPVKET